jgi:hypothetical protein
MTAASSYETRLDGFMRSLLLELKSEEVLVKTLLSIVSDNAISPSCQLLGEQQRKRRQKEQRWDENLGKKNNDNNRIKRVSVVRRYHSNPIESRRIRQRHSLSMVTAPTLNPSRWEPSSSSTSNPNANHPTRRSRDVRTDKADQGLQPNLSILQKARMISGDDSGGYDNALPMSALPSLSPTSVVPKLAVKDSNFNISTMDYNDRWGGVSRNNSDSAILLLRHTLMRPPRRSRDLPLMDQIQFGLRQHQKEEDNYVDNGEHVQVPSKSTSSSFDSSLEPSSIASSSSLVLLQSNLQNDNDDNDERPMQPSARFVCQNFHRRPVPLSNSIVPTTTTSSSTSNEWVQEGDDHFLQSILGSSTYLQTIISSSLLDDYDAIDDDRSVAVGNDVDLSKPTAHRAKTILDKNEEENNNNNINNNNNDDRHSMHQSDDGSHPIPVDSMKTTAHCCILESLLDDTDDQDTESNALNERAMRMGGNTLNVADDVKKNERYCHQQPSLPTSTSTVHHRQHQQQHHQRHHFNFLYSTLYDQILTTLGFFCIAFQVMVQDLRGNSISTTQSHHHRRYHYHHPTIEADDKVISWSLLSSSSSSSSTPTVGNYLGYENDVAVLENNNNYYDDDDDDNTNNSAVADPSLLSCIFTISVPIIQAPIQPMFVTNNKQ